MEGTQIQSTFIPKQSLAQKAGPSPRPTSMAFGLVTVISFVILALSLVLLALTAGYKFTLSQQINRPCDDPQAATTKGCGLVASIAKERNKLDADLLTRFRRLDAKSRIAKEILYKHETLSPLFNLLNDKTLQTIQYRKFTFASAGVILEGVASSYEDIALQSQTFGNTRLIKGFIFSDLKLDDKGNVGFKLEMKLDPQLLNYRNYATINPEDEQAQVAEPQQPGVLLPAGDTQMPTSTNQTQNP